MTHQTAAQSIMDRERDRLAVEAGRSREERQLAAEQEELRLAEDKRRCLLFSGAHRLASLSPRRLPSPQT